MNRDRKSDFKDEKFLESSLHATNNWQAKNERVATAQERSVMLSIRKFVVICE